MEESQKKLYEQCQKKLLDKRQEYLNGLKSLAGALNDELKGDEGDMSQVLQHQNQSLAQREKLLMELREIDAALDRIQTGNYGTCQETGEPIETQRLLAIPWTRFSLEGAENLELKRKRFAG